MICLDKNLSLAVQDRLSRVASGNPLLEALDLLFSIGKLADVTAGDLLRPFAAVHLADDQIL